MLINSIKPHCRPMKLFTQLLHQELQRLRRRTHFVSKTDQPRKARTRSPPNITFAGSIPKTGPENYQWLQQLWTENQWSTFADFLKWYNDLDVTPMIQAIENMNDFYKQKHIDIMHQAIPLPGVAMRVCFNSITDSSAEFHLFNEKNKDIYRLFKQNIVGGPSIIFNRYHEAGKTFIRNNQNQPCQKI